MRKSRSERALTTSTTEREGNWEEEEQREKRNWGAARPGPASGCSRRGNARGRRDPRDPC